MVIGWSSGAIVDLSYGCRARPSCIIQIVVVRIYCVEIERQAAALLRSIVSTFCPSSPSNEKLSHRFRLGVCLVNQPLSFCDVAALPHRVICYPIVPSR